MRVREIAVEVHLIELSGVPEPAEWTVLDPDERARAESFRFPELTTRFVRAHAATRRLLAARVGTAPERLSFARRCPVCGSSEHGKPYLEHEPTVRFNLSHAADLALVALAEDVEVGIDIEIPDRSFDTLVGYALSAPEQARVAAHPPAEQGRAFLRLWTVKEAYLKCSGAGLSVRPTAVDALELLDSGQVVLLPDADSHIAAVAVEPGATPVPKLVPPAP